MLDLEKLSPWGVPTVCPSCGSPLKTTDIDVYCPNENCKTQILLGLSQTIKKLEIKNVSSASLENFGILNFDDLLSFRPAKGYKSQQKFYDELLAKLFHNSEYNLISAMPFKGLSSILLGKILDFYGVEFIKNIQNDPLKLEKMSKMGLPDGIGEAFLERFCDNLQKNLEIVHKITSDGRYSDMPMEKKNTTKNGKSVCFTGAFNTMGRTEASKLAEKAGFEVKSGVSKGLTYLVTNTPNSGSSKNKKAREMGTQIIDEEEFLKLVKTPEEEIFNLT